MKNLTRTFSLILALSLLFAVLLVGCGKPAEKTTEESHSVSTGDSNGLNVPEKDMDGFKLTFLSYTDAAHPWSLKTLVSGDGADFVSEAISERNVRIEAQFGCELAEHQIVYMIETLTQSVMGGIDDIYQVAMIYDGKVNMAKVNGLLSSWDIMPYTDLEKPWWNSDASECFSLDGDQYGAVGDMTLSMYSKNYCYFFNSYMYNLESDAEDLYGLVQDKKWTLEKMLQIGADYTRDLGGDGLHFDGTDQYGIAGTTKVHYQLILSGAGLKFVELDSGGSPYFALNTANAFEIMSDVLGRVSDSNAYYNNNPKNPNGGIVSTEFQNGNVLFLASTIWNMGDYDNYEFQVGVLPAPLYNEDQEQYHSITIGGLVTCISRMIPEADVENVSIILEAMSYYGRRDVVDIYKENLLKARYARTPQDSSMLQLIFDTSLFDLGTSVWNLEIRSPIMENIFNKPDANVSSFIAMITPTANEAINQSRIAA